MTKSSNRSNSKTNSKSNIKTTSKSNNNTRSRGKARIMTPKAGIIINKSYTFYYNVLLCFK